MKDKEEREKEGKERKKNNSKVKPLEPIDDPRNFDFPAGFGSAFIQFERLEDAIRARKEINMREYDSRRVETSYWSKDLFAVDVFDNITISKSEIREAGYVGIENLAIDFADQF